MDARSTIVTTPPPGRRVRSIVQSAVTVVAWLVYLLLWAPGIASGLEALGFHPAIVERLTPEQVADLKLLFQAAGLSVAFSLALVLWANNERRRFGGVERRRRRDDIAITEVARALGAHPDVVEAAQTASVMRVHCRPDGSVAAIEVLDSVGAHPIPRARQPQRDDVARAA